MNFSGISAQHSSRPVKTVILRPNCEFMLQTLLFTVPFTVQTLLFTVQTLLFTVPFTVPSTRSTGAKLGETLEKSLFPL